MVDLRESITEIERFMELEIEQFQASRTHPRSIGIYCSPNNGWISICFNLEQSIEEVDSNCPDFEFVEFGLLTMGSWEIEYEAEIPVIIDHTGKELQITEDDDEKFNQPFFDLLVYIIEKNLEPYKPAEFLVQLLDSDLLIKLT